MSVYISGLTQLNKIYVLQKVKILFSALTDQIEWVSLALFIFLISSKYNFILRISTINEHCQAVLKQNNKIGQKIHRGRMGNCKLKSLWFKSHQDPLKIFFKK